jgi:tRNA(Ile)-lysidine synthase
MVESRHLHYHHFVREKVLRYIRERKLLRAGDRVALAVSGGADSVALLRVLLELREELGVVLAVVHFNHGLRDASAADEAFVATLARQHNLEFFARRGDVRDRASGNKLSLEAAGRELRYACFSSLATEKNFNAIATGHTFDDQAETVLLKFLRGTGTRGLAGIYPEIAIGATGVNPLAPGKPGVEDSLPKGSTSGLLQARIIRPMLGVTRDEVEQYLAGLGQTWCEDESNVDRRFVRNRVRHELLPWLEREYNPNIRKVLSGAAELARGEEDYWQARAAHELQDRIVRVEKKEARGTEGTSHPVVGLSMHNFSHLPLALRRHVLKLLLDSRQLAADFEHIEKLLHCVLGKTAKVELAGGWMAVRQGGVLELWPPRGEELSRFEYQYTLPIPGEVCLAELGLTVRCVPVPQAFAAEAGPPDRLLSAQLLGPKLMVRNWRPGDRFHPLHSRSEEKLKRLFSEHRIPAAQRSSWPVALQREQIVWVCGFPVARAFAWNGRGDAIRIETV